MPAAFIAVLFSSFKYWDSRLRLHWKKISAAKEKFENHWTGSRIPKPGCSTEFLKEFFKLQIPGPYI